MNINISFFIVDGKWKINVHITLCIFHFKQIIELTVDTRTYVPLRVTGAPPVDQLKNHVMHCTRLV